MNDVAINEITGLILAVCAAFTTMSVALNWGIKWWVEIRKPTKKQDKQIAENTEHIESHERRFAKDEQELQQIKEQNRLTMLALFALLEHALDGNNTAQMKTVKNDLQKFLVGK